MLWKKGSDILCNVVKDKVVAKDQILLIACYSEISIMVVRVTIVYYYLSFV